MSVWFAFAGLARAPAAVMSGRALAGRGRDEDFSGGLTNRFLCVSRSWQDELLSADYKAKAAGAADEAGGDGEAAEGGSEASEGGSEAATGGSEEADGGEA